MKATITTSLGTFEFEGEDEAVREQIAAILDSPVCTNASKAAAKNTHARAKVAAPHRTVTQPKMLPNLLTTKDEIDSVKAFFAEKAPDSHIEKFAVLTLWLRNSKNIADASVDEMWTLYKMLGIRQPKNLIQTFRDGKSKKSYFESTTDGRYSITPFGETFVDFDLPALKREK